MLIAFFPEFILFSFIIFSIFSYSFSLHRLFSYGNSFYLYLLFFLIVFIVLSFLFVNTGLDVFYFFGSFHISRHTMMFKLLFFVFAALVVFMNIIYQRGVDLNSSYMSSFDYSILVSFFLLSSCFMMDSNDFIVFYIMLEVQRFSSYLLTLFKKDLFRTTEAALKYFILGSISSTFFILGVALLYWNFGTLNWLEIELLSSSLFIGDRSLNNVSLFAVILILVSLFFKFPAFPFHNWAVDVYSATTKNILAIFLVLPKIVLFFVIVTLFSSAFYFFLPFCAELTLWVGFFSVLIGSAGAYFQQSLKRFLAYGTLVHVGWILVGLSTFSSAGFNSAFIYLLVYLLNIVLLLFIVILSDSLVPSTFSDVILSFRDSGVRSLYSLVWVVSLFSLAGIPPLAGFFAKFLILFQLIVSGNFFVAFFLLFFSVVSAYYYIRLIRLLLFSIYKVYNNQVELSKWFIDFIYRCNSIFWFKYRWFYLLSLVFMAVLMILNFIFLIFCFQILLSMNFYSL